MQKRFFSFFLALAMLSGVSFAMAQTPSPSPAPGQVSSAQNLGLQNLPIPYPIKTITSRDGHTFQIMASQINSTSQLYFIPIPEVKIDKKNCFNPQTNRFSFNLVFPSKTEEISDLLKSDGFNTKQLVQMPLVGYSVSVTYGKKRQEIDFFDGSVQILDGISCSDVIKNKDIIQALKTDIDHVNAEVKIICNYQKLLGSCARMGFEDQFKRKLQEKILGDKTEVFMSRDSFNKVIRDVSNEIQSSGHNSRYMIVIGNNVKDLIDVFIKQNPNMFVEKTMEEIGEHTEFWMYDPEFGLKEIMPDEVSDVKNECEKFDEVKNFMKSNWETLHQIRKHSKDENHFKELVEKTFRSSEKGEGGFDIGGFSFGASGDASEFSTSDSDTSRDSIFWKDFYNMTTQKSFNEKDFYNKSMEHWKGDVRKVASLPKDYKVIRIGADELNSISNFYCQKSDIDITAEPLTYKTCIKEAITHEEKNELRTKEEAEAAEKKRQAVVKEAIATAVSEATAKDKAEAEAAAAAAAVARAEATEKEAEKVKAIAEVEAKTKAEAEAAAKAKAATEAAAKARAKAKAAAEEAAIAKANTAKAKAAEEEAKGNKLLYIGFKELLQKNVRELAKIEAVKTKAAVAEAAKAKAAEDTAAKDKAKDKAAAEAAAKARAKAKAAAEAAAKASAKAKATAEEVEKASAKAKTAAEAAAKARIEAAKAKAQATKAK